MEVKQKRGEVILDKGAVEVGRSRGGGVVAVIEVQQKKAHQQERWWRVSGCRDATKNAQLGRHGGALAVRW